MSNPADCRRRYDRLKAKGLCTVCGNKEVEETFTKCHGCREDHRKASLESHAKLKRETFDRYGGVCVCCGEKEERFLHIDHKEGHGNEHRRSIGGHSGGKFYRWLKRRGFPPGYQVLCANCNLAKGFFGECPHKTARDKALTDLAYDYVL
jgi:hypothetical protein